MFTKYIIALLAVPLIALAVETHKEKTIANQSVVPLSVLMPPGSYLMVEGLDKWLHGLKKHYPKDLVRVIDPKTKHRFEIRRLD